MRFIRSLLALYFLFLLYGPVNAQKGDSTEYQYALIEALKQKNLGNPSEAVKLYRLIIREQSDCAVAHYELGGIYLMSKQNELAVLSLEKSYSMDSENVWFTRAYLNALGASGDFSTMETVLKLKIQENPGDVEWMYQMANVYASQEKFRKALKTLKQIERDKGFSEKVSLLKATVYESNGEYELALEELSKVMILFPQTLQFRVAAAELCAKGGNYRQSLLYMAEAFDNPGMDLRQKMAVFGVYLSDESVRENFPVELEKLLLLILEDHSDEVNVLLVASDYYIQSRDYTHAFQYLQSYLELVPEPRFELYLQALMLANAASLNNELLDISGRALEYYPDSSDLSFFRGIGLYENRDYEALQELLEGCDFSGFSSDEYRLQARILLAESYNSRAYFSKADSIFDQLILSDPENYLILNNYAYYLAERGERLKEAEKWSKKAVDANSDNGTFIDTYAWVLFKLERWEEAEKYILKALEKGGENDPDVNEHAGDIQAAMESWELAKSYYQKAIILGGERSKLENKIETLVQESE